MLKVAIVGSREFSNTDYVLNKFLQVIEQLSQIREDVRLLGDKMLIVSGGAQGVDTCAQEIAKLLGLPILIYYPDWQTYGKEAALRRNTYIVDIADVVIAFPSRNSKGTWDTINKAHAAGKPVFVFEVSTNHGKEASNV